MDNPKISLHRVNWYLHHPKDRGGRWDDGLDLTVISASQSSISTGAVYFPKLRDSLLSHTSSSLPIPMPAVKEFENTGEAVAKKLGVLKKHVTYLCRT